MTEDDGMRIDLRRMFPEAARRAEILERLKRSWPRVVMIPAVWRYSSPSVLGADYLVVEAWNDSAKSVLSKMRGNIQRALSALGYETGEDFTLRINGQRQKRQISPKHEPAHRKPETDAELVIKYMAGAPETLPEEINYALSHLRAYLDGRASVMREKH